MINKNIRRWILLQAEKLILFSFFFSGCAALIYQVGWQRALYALIGVDMDSITIIVSVFMLGIGLGGMLGGWLADKYPRRRLIIYAVVELTIASYGAISLFLLNELSDLLITYVGGGFVGAVVCFFFLLLPTILMGITLPLLTMALNERCENIGLSVGMLYFINTLGAAVGAAVVPFVLFKFLTLPQVIWVAVAGNLMVVLFALLAVSAGKYAEEQS